MQQQLNALDSGHLSWRGEVWEGQSMDWDIFEQPNGEKNELNYSTKWYTIINLSMPQLGNITTTITLYSEGVDIKLHVSKLDTAMLLEDNKYPFMTDMQSAGLDIQSVIVQHDDAK